MGTGENNKKQKEKYKKYRESEKSLRDKLCKETLDYKDLVLGS